MRESTFECTTFRWGCTGTAAHIGRVIPSAFTGRLMGPDESKRALAENSQALCALPVDKALKGGNGHKGAKV